MDKRIKRLAINNGLIISERIISDEEIDSFLATLKEQKENGN